MVSVNAVETKCSAITVYVPREEVLRSIEYPLVFATAAQVITTLLELSRDIVERGAEGGEYGGFAFAMISPLNMSLTRMFPLGKKGYVYEQDGSVRDCHLERCE